MSQRDDLSILSIFVFIKLGMVNAIGKPNFIERDLKEVEICLI